MMNINRKQLMGSYVLMFILILLNADYFGLVVW